MRILVLFIAFLMTGCSSQPAPKTYFIALQHAAGSATSTGVIGPSESCSLSVNQVSMADYLNSNGLVYQTSPQELVVARQHLWAGSLAEQIQFRLNNLLSQSCTLPTSWTLPANSPAKPVQLALTVTEFYGSYIGDAVIGGQWRLLDGMQQVLLEQPFQYRIPLTEEGYPALVNSMDKGLIQLAGDIRLMAAPHMQSQLSSAQ
ncbi:PqiC family protein [Shewanella sp.]|uniref:PqiC family protein n=1 Tax=Shewanella sp. TaxID=50422 RepID=UPI003A8BAC27